MKIQTKSSVEIKLKKLFKSYAKLDGKIFFNKWQQAKIVQTMADSIAWKITEYGSFTVWRKKFMPNVSLCSSVTAANYFRHSTRLGYTLQEIKVLSKKYSFTVLGSIFTMLKTKLTIVELKKRYPESSITIINAVDKKGNVHKVIKKPWTFNLDKPTEAKLVILLSRYGYIHKKGLCSRSTKQSASLQAFLDDYIT